MKGMYAKHITEYIVSHYSESVDVLTSTNKFF